MSEQLKQQDSFKISKSSWYWIFMKYMYDHNHVIASKYKTTNPYQIDNLCMLVNRFILNVFVFLIDVICAILLIATPTLAVLNMVGWYTLAETNNPYHLMLVALGTAVFWCIAIAIFIILLVVVCEYVVKLVGSITRNVVNLKGIPSDDEIIKQPSIITQYVKDRHSKICRRIDFTD